MDKWINLIADLEELKIFTLVKDTPDFILLKTTLPIMDYLENYKFEGLKYDLYRKVSEWTLKLFKEKSEESFAFGVEKMIDTIRKNIRENELPILNDTIEEKKEEDYIWL